jgi:hypothetical protein
MSIYQVSVDVYCETAYEHEPAYRVYIDKDLLTERTWSWPRHEIYIKERIVVDIDSGTHQVRIEPIGDFAGFGARNLTVNGVVQDQQDLSFTV